jgi:hypothetical protein
METNLDEIPDVPQNEQTSQEQNDSNGTSHRKTLKEARLEKFEQGDYILKLEEMNYLVIPFDGSKLVIDTQTEEYGVIDYFPKANKVLIRKENSWKPHGLKWMLDNLFKTE